MLVEYLETTPEARATCTLLTAAEVARKSKVAKQRGLLCGMWSLTHDPFEDEAINEAILQYLYSFVEGPNFAIAERWHGIYPKLEGQSDLIVHPEPGVTIVNGLSGAGMTLSFGLAEEVIEQTLG